MSIDHSQKTAAYILDELYSMTDEEIADCFRGYSSIKEVITNIPVTKIGETIDEYYQDTAESKAEEDPFKKGLSIFLRHVDWFTTEEAEELNKEGLLEGLVVRFNRYVSTALILYKLYRKYPRVVLALNIEDGIKKRIRAGDIVRFRLEKEYNRIRAVGICIAGHVNTRSRGIDLPNGNWLDNKKILRYGYGNAMHVAWRNSGLTNEEFSNELSKRNIVASDLKYVYISSRTGEYKVFREGTPIHGDGQVPSLENFVKELDHEVFGMNGDQLPATTLTEIKNTEIKKAERNENEEDILPRRRQAFTTTVKAYLMNMGYLKSQAKAFVTQTRIEKKLEEGILDVDKDDPEAVAKTLAVGKRPKKNDENQIKAAFYNIILGHMQMTGLTKKEAKEIAIKNNLYQNILDEKLAINNPKDLAATLLKKTPFKKGNAA